MFNFSALIHEIFLYSHYCVHVRSFDSVLRPFPADVLISIPDFASELFSSGELFCDMYGLSASVLFVYALNQIDK